MGMESPEEKHLDDLLYATAYVSIEPGKVPKNYHKEKKQGVLKRGLEAIGRKLCLSQEIECIDVYIINDVYIISCIIYKYLDIYLNMIYIDSIYIECENHLHRLVLMRFFADVSGGTLKQPPMKSKKALRSHDVQLD